MALSSISFTYMSLHASQTPLVESLQTNIVQELVKPIMEKETNLNYWG